MLMLYGGRKNCSITNHFSVLDYSLTAVLNQLNGSDIKILFLSFLSETILSI